jgi:hypothetical protein
MAFIKKEPLNIKIKNAKKELCSKKVHEKIQKMTKTLHCLKWTLKDFFMNLNLMNKSWDSQWNVNSFVLIHEKLKIAFGKREHNGWKVRPNELIICSNYARLQKLYELVYGHVPTNGDYSTFFLRGWLVQHKNHEINWAQYAYDTIQEQMRRTK